MITLTGPVPARQVGACNGCPNTRDNDGYTKRDAIVYDMWIHARQSGGVTLRLCPDCMHELQVRVNLALEVQE